MPEMDGLELLKTMLVQYPFVRRIVITGKVSLDYALACMRAGADTFIFKPIDLDKLDAAVEKAVETIRHWFDLLKELRALAGEDI
jgi:two-component system response regulator YesN